MLASCLTSLGVLMRKGPAESRPRKHPHMNIRWYTPYTLGRIELERQGATVTVCLDGSCSNVP